MPCYDYTMTILCNKTTHNNTILYCTILPYSTTQHSTAQHRTTQHSTAHYTVDGNNSATSQHTPSQHCSWLLGSLRHGASHALRVVCTGSSPTSTQAVPVHVQSRVPSRLRSICKFGAEYVPPATILY